MIGSGRRGRSKARAAMAAAVIGALVGAGTGGTARAEAAPAVSATAPAPATGPAMLPGIPNGPMLTPGENTEETYQLNYVGIRHFETGGYMGANGKYVAKTEWWEGYRGKYKLKLGLLEFYDAVARPDLHAKGTHHAIVTASVLVAGLGFFGAGSYYTFKQFHEHGSPTIGLVGIGLGFVCLLTAKAMTFQPTSESESYGLARAYNDRLRAHLGLPPIVEDPTQPSASVPWRKRLAFAASVAPSGGGLILLGSF
jgi:hypothetical protein